MSEYPCAAIGRPLRLFAPGQLAELKAEYIRKPFNVSERARILGVDRSVLGYHMRGGKSARIFASSSWRQAVYAAYTMHRQGKLRESARWLRVAAARMTDHLPRVKRLKKKATP